ALLLDADGARFVEEVQRHTDADFLVGGNAHEIGVHDDGLVRMALQVLENDLRLFLAHLELEDGRVKAFVLQLVLQLGVVDGDRNGVLVTAVDDPGHLVRTTQAAARTFPRIRTNFDIQREVRLRHFNYLWMVSLPARDQAGTLAVRRQTSSVLRIASIHIQRGNRFLVGNPAHRLRQDVGDAELADALAALRVLAQRNRVGDDDFVQRGVLDVLDRLAGEHRVRDVRVHRRGALFLERGGRLAQRAGGVDQVIDDHAGLARDRADDVHHLGFGG